MKNLYPKFRLGAHPNVILSLLAVIADRHLKELQHYWVYGMNFKDVARWFGLWPPMKNVPPEYVRALSFKDVACCFGIWPPVKKVPPEYIRSLNDAVALRTEWTPIEDESKIARTYYLTRPRSGRLEYRATFNGRIQFSVGILGCAMVSTMGILFLGEAFWAGEFDLKTDYAMVVSTGVALYVLVSQVRDRYAATAPMVFDRQLGLFWKGRKVPTGDWNTSKQVVKIDDIHALQTIQKHYTRELNLVLEDGERVNLLSHVDRYVLQEDAAIISSFLGKPVWEATR